MQARRSFASSFTCSHMGRSFSAPPCSPKQSALVLAPVGPRQYFFPNLTGRFALGLDSQPASRPDEEFIVSARTPRVLSSFPELCNDLTHGPGEVCYNPRPE